MLAARIKESLAKGYVVAFYEARPEDGPPKLTMEMSTLGGHEAFGADFDYEDFSGDAIIRELEGLEQLHLKRQQSTGNISSEAPESESYAKAG